MYLRPAAPDKRVLQKNGAENRSVRRGRRNAGPRCPAGPSADRALDKGRGPGFIGGSGSEESGRQLAKPSEKHPPIPTRNRFNTFGGVFTPSVLTIIGVILFMRLGFVVGQAGILHAVAILLFAKTITLLTTLSISAVATNTEIRGGGAYFMISRVLGPEFGGAIGIALFAAQALSAPFYILGFTEAVTRSFPALAPFFFQITIVTAIALFAITYTSASVAIRTQYIIMTFLVLSIAAYLSGAFSLFSIETWRDNLQPSFTAIEGREGGTYSFWIVFAIFFPAVTGILAGVNMSGDLENPARSIPRGTLAAIGVAFLVYLATILAAGGAFERGELIERPFDLLKDNALFGLGFVVVAGVFAATLSSAIGSLLGAPRVLQAVSRDGILPVLEPFSHGAIKGDEPRRASLLAFAITLAVLVWAGDGTGGMALNSIAAVITMFFLYTYGMINLAAFTEAFGGNPSFRPRFRLFHWTGALAGAGGCVAAAILINFLAALAAIVIIAGLLLYIRTRELISSYGDARRGFVYASVRRNLVRLAAMREDPKNWRPTVLVFSGNPATREDLVTYSIWLESGRGIVMLANILLGSPARFEQHRKAAVRQLQDFCAEKSIQAFPMVLVAEDLESGASMLLQSASVGPIAPNVAVFGWKSDRDRLDAFVRFLRLSEDLRKSIVLINARPLDPERRRRRIDVWWRGRENGSLMLLLAFLLSRNWEWSGSSIRVLRQVGSAAGREPAAAALQELIDRSRVGATSTAVVSDRPFAEVVKEVSGDSDCVFLGFENPASDREADWHAFYEGILAGMPTTLLVNSQAGEDILV